MTRKKLLKQIQAVGLVLDELRLFLDTHPNHCIAQQDFIENLKRRAELLQQYAYLFGPLVWEHITQESNWTWVDAPWPWEVEA